jgi:hypothetical protein
MLQLPTFGGSIRELGKEFYNWVQISPDSTQRSTSRRQREARGPFCCLEILKSSEETILQGPLGSDQPARLQTRIEADRCGEKGR